MNRTFAMAAVVGLALPARAQPAGEFVPGQIFFSENNAEFNFHRVRVFDPVTGGSSIFLDETDGLDSASGLSFTPDGRFLRVLSRSNSRIYNADGAGNVAMVYDADDGVFAPSGQNGMAWDVYGNYFVSSAAHVIFRLDAAGGPATIFANAGPSGMAFAPDGDLFEASGAVVRITPNGNLTVFDADFGFNEEAMTLALSARGDLFVGTDQNGWGRIYRYAGSARENRELLPGAYDAGNGAFTLALSTDEATLWVVDSFFLYSVDLLTGEREIVAEFGQQPLVSWGRGLAVYAPPSPGDLTCDKRVNFFDIDPFLLALFDPTAYEAQFSFCRRDLADLNADGSVDFFDVHGFIAALFAE